MANRNISESQQQGQGVTIGTQGNEDQPTPHGDDINYQQEKGRNEKEIPNQEKSSAASQDQHRNSGGWLAV